jgi:hypothetical protein
LIGPFFIRGPSLIYCLQLLQGKNAIKALNSNAWLMVSERVVQEVLKLDQLDVSETEAVKALLKWGRAQLEASGHTSSDNTNKLLRDKIDSSLKCIRWSHFNAKQFAELCQGEFGLVLSSEERLKIYECIALNQWGSMPPQLAGPQVPKVKN